MRHLGCLPPTHRLPFRHMLWDLAVFSWGKSACRQRWQECTTVLWCDKRLVRWKDEGGIYGRWFCSTTKNLKLPSVAQKVVYFRCHGQTMWCWKSPENTDFSSASALQFSSFFLSLFSLWRDIRNKSYVHVRAAITEFIFLRNKNDLIHCILSFHSIQGHF